MSGGITFRNAQEFAAAVQSVVAHGDQARAKDSANRPGGQFDTSADQSGGVPGKDVDLASFGNMSYSPSPVLPDVQKPNADGGCDVIEIVSGYMTGWTANRGSSYTEDTVTKKIGTDGFSGTFRGWSNGFT